MPGCYQLESRVSLAGGGRNYRRRISARSVSGNVECSARIYRGFLPGAINRLRMMDRLHAYCYFLEGISPMLTLADCREAWSQAADAIACRLRKIAPEFVRWDVYAQLLRARLLGATVVPLDLKAAGEEADALVSFHAVSDDPRVDGSFLFGRTQAPCRHTRTPYQRLLPFRLSRPGVCSAGGSLACLPPIYR